MDELSAASCTENWLANDKAEICVRPKSWKERNSFSCNRKQSSEKKQVWNLTNFLAFNQVRQGRGCRSCFLSPGPGERDTSETCMPPPFLFPSLSNLQKDQIPLTPFSISVHPVYFCLCYVFTHVLLIFCAIYSIYKWFHQTLRFRSCCSTAFFFAFDIVYIIYKCTVFFLFFLFCFSFFQGTNFVCVRVCFAHLPKLWCVDPIPHVMWPYPVLSSGVKYRRLVL